MVERLDFEHQKMVNMEAYTYGLVNRIDLNFVGIVDNFSDLPLLGNQTDDAYYVRNGISNWMYIWDWASWAKDTAWWSTGWINYTSFPTTVGNRLAGSVWTWADFIQETGIGVDSAGNLTFPGWTTHNYTTGVAITGIQNFGSWYTGNYTDSTLNHDNTVSNYTNGSAITYDNTTNVDMQGTTTIANLIIVNPIQWYTWKEEVPTGLVNSSNVNYTLSETASAGSSFVYLNGLAQKYTTDYTITGTTLTFVTAPSTGATLFVKYMY